MTRYVVQFPHPSNEYRVKGKIGVMPWNTKRHARKFLSSPGTALDESGAPVHGDLVFWGEWESESRYRALEGRPTDAHPRAVHRPYWVDPEDGPFRQNTDPYVFGDCFRYTNCKQLRAGRPSWLQSLDLGSVILFGGSRCEEFFVDTVLVVASRHPWSVRATEEVLDPVLRRVTCDSVRTDPNPLDDFTLYEGATAADPFDGMCSFVPCMPEDSAPQGFVRPVVRLPGMINGRSLQAQKGTAVTAQQAYGAWTSVREQVLRQGLLLGTHFTTPPQE